MVVCALLCVSAGGCGSASITEETNTVTAGETNTAMEPKTEEKIAFDGTVHARNPVSLSEMKDRLKCCGRAVFDENALHADWPCAGFEMDVEAAGGDFTLSYRFSTAAMITVLVDGAEAARHNLSGTGSQALTTLSPGAHRIAVLRDVETRPGAESVFTRVAFEGRVLERPADRELLLEFIGDSIVSGNGALTEGRARWTAAECSATHAFGYLTAQALGADVTIAGRGSIGLVRTVEDKRGVPFAMPALYRYATGLSHEPRIDFDFASARVPDAVILECSTNDRSAVSDEDFRAAATGFLQTIRKNYGKDVPVVWVYNLMTADHHEAVLLDVVASLGGAGNGYYALKLVAGQNGGKGTETGTCHPSYGDHLVNADLLTAFLRENVLTGA
ncbi:MAG: hypothetical protein II776_03315 [Clostridia bacterium]|nr:hypothetical protein [Clostridia bacterium]